MWSLRVTQIPLFFLLCIIGASLSGCGETLSASPGGVYVDTTTEQFLQKAFDETKACTGLKEGKFEEVAVVLMPPTFPCEHYANKCSGEYVAPNSVKIGSLYVWRHELIHYFIYVNTGDPDSSHQNSLFNTCA